MADTGPQEVHHDIFKRLAASLDLVAETGFAQPILEEGPHLILVFWVVRHESLGRQSAQLAQHGYHLLGTAGYYRLFLRLQLIAHLRNQGSNPSNRLLDIGVKSASGRFLNSSYPARSTF
jgi:hypothetical protein